MRRTHIPRRGRRAKPLTLSGIVLALALAALAAWLRGPQGAPSSTAPASTATAGAASESIEQAIESKLEEVWVRAEGAVSKLLPDDTEGDEHQRFLVQLSNGTTVLIAHNTDVARRVPVAEDDRVTFRGKYVWNDKGGVVHWTHRHSRREEEYGWIEHNGQRYE